jgi:integrase
MNKRRFMRTARGWGFSYDIERPGGRRRIRRSGFPTLAAAQKSLISTLSSLTDQARQRRGPDKSRHTWTSEQLQHFLASVQDDPLGPLFVLLAITGVRRDEALRLAWSDVDLIRRTIAVTEPKTSSGHRIIAIDARTAVALQAARERQRERAAQDPDARIETDLVFTRDDGTAWPPDVVTRQVTGLARAAGLPAIRLHDLRRIHQQGVVA